MRESHLKRSGWSPTHAVAWEVMLIVVIITAITKLYAPISPSPIPPFLPSPCDQSYWLRAASHRLSWRHILPTVWSHDSHSILRGKYTLSAQPRTLRGPLKLHWWADFEYSDQMAVSSGAWFKFLKMQMRSEDGTVLSAESAAPILTVYCF